VDNPQESENILGVLAFLRSVLAPAAALLFATGCLTSKIPELFAQGDERELRERPEGAAPASTISRPNLLILAIDGVGRDLLYDMLEKGDLPELAKLLYGRDGEFPHAHFSRRALSTLPSTTMAAWVTALTGVGPAHHGVTGNEFFIREKTQFAAPAPVTFSDPAPLLACFTDGYANALSAAPSVYERMRKRDPSVLIWVAGQHFYRGADKFLLTDRGVIADAAKAFVEQTVAAVASDESMDVYESLDEEIVEAVLEELDDEDHPLPNVLTVYFTGADLYAHVSDVGPDRARRDYLKQGLEPEFEKLRKQLGKRHGLEDRFVVVIADHGHTEVSRSDKNALGTDFDEDPPGVLAKAGFRVRDFKLEVDKDADFQAVLAYQGAVAYVYVADRSTCEKKGERCDWKKPPRYREDVLKVAEAFYRNNLDGKLIPAMKGTLDMVLTRRPKPYAEVDARFAVYAGNGKLVPVDAWLKAHPHPTYVAVSERLEDLGVGPLGERAGDVVLLAHNGDRQRVEQRYYFASNYRSWHGSPSRLDSEIPLIVAHPRQSEAELRKIVDGALGEQPFQQRFTDVLMDLRYGAER
jgi:hypothetical protein